MNPAILFLGVFLTLSAQAVTWGDFLRGHWVTDCKPVGLRYEQTGYTFSDFVGPEFAMVHRGFAVFSDAKCTRAYTYGQVLGHLNLSSQTAPQKGAKITMQISPLVQFPFAGYEQGAVDELNRKNYCGKSDWQWARAKDFLDTSCGKELRQYYDSTAFSLEVTDPDHLRIRDPSGNREDLHRWVFKATP